MERRLRIGELAERTGVTPDALRAWERRYGLLEPERSEGRYRLYTGADEQRVQAMARYLDAGVPAGEAARLVLAGSVVPEKGQAPWLPGVADELRAALDRFDEAAAEAALDTLVVGVNFETIASAVLLPYLRELGQRWRRGEATVAQEHFASSVLRARLLALGRGWDRGLGPRALLACAPGERHDLGLVIFGLALRHQGWRITHLGADTPVDTLAATAQELAPAAVVVVALTTSRLSSVHEPLTTLARTTRLLLAGAGARPRHAEAIGAELLGGGPIDAARHLADSLLRAS